MPTEDKCTLLKKNRKELVVNMLFCGILGCIAGVTLSHIVGFYIFSIISAVFVAETLGLTVNLSLIKEIKNLKANLKQEKTEMEIEQFEVLQLEERKQEECQEKKKFLVETPITQMNLYGYRGVFYPIYFDLEEKQKFNKDNDIPMQFLHSLEFIGDYAGKRNVIRIYSQENIVNNKEHCVAMDEYGYVILNKEKSMQNKSYIWETCKEYIDGINIKDIYVEFQKRGIVLEKDIYNQEETEHQNEETARKIVLNKK